MGNGSPAYSDGDLEAALERVGDHIENLNSRSQIDMLMLNTLMSKRQQIFEMTSNVLKKLDDTKSAIISNIR